MALLAEKRDRPRHRNKTHRRWVERLNHPAHHPDQCGICTYWVPLSGEWGLDWGVCTNGESSLDGRAQFEHDHCDAFERAREWATPDG
jgi:hypothetical protein